MHSPPVRLTVTIGVGVARYARRSPLRCGGRKPAAITDCFALCGTGVFLTCIPQTDAGCNKVMFNMAKTIKASKSVGRKVNVNLIGLCFNLI